MTIAESPRTARIARRTAEILEERVAHSADIIARRIADEHGLNWDEHGANVQLVVGEVMTGSRVVELRRAGTF